jgi:predicted Zn-dependent peptidase
VNRIALALAAAAIAACGSSSRSPTSPGPGSAVTPTEEPPLAQPSSSQSSPQPTASPQQLVFPDEPMRAQQPPAAAPRPFRLPAVKTFKLKSGIQVYLVERHDLPIASIDLVVDGGAVADPRGKEGLASVCMSMLTEGTQALDKIAFSEALADVASSIDTFAGDDTQGVSMSTLSKHFDATFALFSDVLLRPGLRADDLDRMIKRRLESLKQAKGAPASVASRVSGPVLYGPEHPMGTITTEASLGRITLDDCRAYHATWLKPNKARLFVVGDMTEARLRAYFDGPALASWKGKQPAMPKLPATATRKGRIFLVHMPGAAQSQVTLMHFGPKRTAPDYIPTALMASLYGGSFTSRLNMNLREDKGYSYGARGGFSYTRAYGIFSAGASVRTDATYQTVLEIDRDLKALWSGKQPPTTDELTREKSSAILSLPGRFATGGSTLSAYRSLAYFGLPLDYFTTFAARVEKSTAAQVAAAARKHLRPGQAVYVVVGDGDAPVIARDGKDDKPLLRDGKPVTLRAALTELAVSGTIGAGGLVELDVDGVPR